MRGLGFALLLGLQVPGGQAQNPAYPLRPAAIAFDAAGDLFFTDSARHQVYEVTLAGVLRVIAGTGTQGFGGDGGLASSALLNEPQGIVVAADGTLYLADTGNQRVRVVRSGVISTLAGDGVAGFAGDGAAAGSARLNRPMGLALMTDGTLLIADSGNHRVRAVRSGAISTLAGSGTQGFAGDGGRAVAARLDTPEAVGVAGDGRVLIADTHNGRLRAVNTDGTLATLAGSGTAGFAGDGGPAIKASMSLPSGVAVDASGTVYFTDSGNHRVRATDPGGVMRTLGGAGSEGTAVEGGIATSASLDGPQGIAVSPLGVVWFADLRNAAIRAIVPGVALATSSSTPPGNRLYQPAGVVSRSSIVTLQRDAAQASGQIQLGVSVAGQAGLPQGQVRLREGSTVLVEGALSGGTVSLSLPSLSIGTHTLTADYLGDVLNPAASATLSDVGSGAIPLLVSADAATMRYGEAVPTLTGSIMNLPAQNAGKVQAVFATIANSLSDVGTYPITATLAGPAALNYVAQLSPTSGQLTISPGPSSTTLLMPLPTGYAGLPLSLTATVSAAISGKPTGTIAFLENGAVLGTAPAVNGSATATLAGLAVGQHAITTQYSGDRDFAPSTSAPATLLVDVLPDFSLTAAKTAVPTIDPGTSATFSLTVSGSPGPFTGVVALAASGLPTGWTARFAPPTVIPGVQTVPVTLTVTASGNVRLLRPVQRFWPEAVAVAFLLPLLLAPADRKRPWRALSLIVLIGGVTGCGARIASTADISPPRQLSFTVTATATNLAGQVVTHAVVMPFLQP